MEISNADQGSVIWEQLRWGRFTASPISKIIMQKPEKLTDGAKTYCMEKATEIMYQRTISNFKNDAMEWGNKHEPTAAIEYGVKNGVFPRSVGFMYSEHYGCSPDRLIGQDGGIEIKCPKNPLHHTKHCLIRSPKDLLKASKAYYWQIQMSLLCTGRDWWDFVSFDPRLTNHLRLFQFRIHREEAPLEKLRVCLDAAIKEKINILTQLKM